MSVALEKRETLAAFVITLGVAVVWVLSHPSEPAPQATPWTITETETQPKPADPEPPKVDPLPQAVTHEAATVCVDGTCRTGEGVDEAAVSAPRARLFPRLRGRRR